MSDVPPRIVNYRPTGPLDLFSPSTAELGRLDELRRFVEAVWAPGWHALGVQRKGEDYRHVDTFVSPDAWIAAATPYVRSDHHVWLGVNGMAERPPSRGGNADVTSSRALSMDLDYLAPASAHANADLPTREQIVGALARLGDIRPNVVIATGWGFQPHWKLSSDIDPERRQGLLFAVAARLMELEPQLRIERLDLAGMFRVPGSTNIKVEGDPRPVVIEYWTEGPGFTPEYLKKRCPPVAVPTHRGGARHVTGPVTEDQRKLLAYLTDHHGGHGDWATRDGQIRVVRPGKSPKDGHSANIWMGSDGVAVATVFSPDWPELGPMPPEQDRSWALRADGKGLCHPENIEASIVINATAPATITGGKGNAKDEPRRLLTWKRAPNPFVIPRVEWMIEGLWCAGTHGEMAGGEKTLKSTLSTIIDVGLAAGVPVLGHFHVAEPRRVLHLAGEGGEVGYWGRLGRVCAAYGVSVDQVRENLLVTFGTASMSNPVFVREVEEQLESFGPALTHLDPYYAYSPRGVDPRQLVEVGAALEAFGSLCGRAGSTVLINNHYNQTGSGNGLTRITGAGHAEWVDSWLLVSHRQLPDVPGGRFWLRLEVGSRKWGGTSWEVDMNLGQFDPGTGLHLGAIKWSIRPATTTTPDPQDVHDARIAQAKVDLLKVAHSKHKRKPFTKSELTEDTAGTKTIKLRGFDQLVEVGTFVQAGTRTVPWGKGTREVPVFKVNIGP
jgi:hypothetical protein